MQHAHDRAAQIEQIAALNDALRANITKPTGLDRIVMTAGIAGGIGDVAKLSGWRKRAELIRAVRDFDAFSPDSPERDFGRFEWQEATCFFKIDYYDPSLEWGSADPADPTVTARVLTIMWAYEY